MLSLFQSRKIPDSESETGRRVKILTYLIIGYLLLGLAWWTLLLYTKNKDAYEAKVELLRIGMVAEGKYSGEVEFLAHPKYIDLQKKYRRQEFMIYGEAGLLILSMSIGIWLMNRGYMREIQVARQKRNFLLSITHELKSPLAAIRLVFDTFRKRKLNESQLQLLTENGLADTERLRTLVDNLLLAARMEDNYIPGKEAYRIDEVIQPIVDEISHRHKKATIKLQLNCKAVAEIEKQGIQIMVSNLIENAIKYSKESPEIDIYIEENDNEIILSIADKGIGIPDEEKEFVFHKFYRIGSEETRTTKGTGLGLYIVKGIVNAHRGKIKILNNTPRGTIFKIILPKK
jgi:signal transduction histidine kinase